MVHGFQIVDTEPGRKQLVGERSLPKPPLSFDYHSH
ncbi:hypothetical protein B6N60_04353 [Richelia sinica FACHB-800]|uniref:Uncharacterized protein n=1 Tax=Richelia sinica FACHB-800 TaxID=1357546 RepID=A0A975Y6U0_9NOST|nr:hypothetical protein B6N60_04353 [Richelia sinica FACHB-800]